MTRSRARRTALVMMMVAGMLAAVSVLFAGAASAQDVACPAGARGGAGGDAGRSTGGNGGLGFTVGGLASDTGNATAAGANGGSARGGTGGRGGSGTLPICNQNTNGGGGGSRTSGGGAGGPAYGAGGGSPRYGTGGGLARTGSHTSTELGLAGFALLIGGALLFAGQPVRRVRARA